MRLISSGYIKTLLVGATLLGSSAAMALIESTPPPAPPPNGVSIGWMVFVPAELTVKVGTTVTWTNWDDANHGVTFADGTKSDRLVKKAIYTRAFGSPGEYPYQCTFHGAKMVGKIIVK